MFLLRRRSDGKFWNNSGTRQGDAWVTDIQECTPFRTRQSARMARCFGYVPSKTKWGGRFKKEREEADLKFTKDYEVLEVKLCV